MARLGLLAALVIAALAYTPVLDAPFVYEDHNWVYGLSSAEQPSSWLATRWPGRTVTGWSYYVQADRGMAYPRPYHIVNVLLHLFCGVLVYALARRLALGRLASVAACAVFLWHPLNSQAVAYVSARTDLLWAAFTLSAVLLVWWPVTGWRSAVRWMAVSACLVGALGSKELGLMSLPMVAGAALADRWRPWLAWASAGAVLAALALFLPTLPVLVRDADTAAMWPSLASRWALVESQAVMFWRTVALVALPVGLSIDPDPWGGAVRGLHVIAPWALVGVTVWAAGWWSRIGLGAWVAVLLVLGPRLVIPTAEPIHEHHAYLAMAPWSLLIGEWIGELT